jgi:STE24 endopeptidase
MTSSRKVAVAVVVSGLLLFVLLAALLVPWDPVPGGRLTPPGADTVFTAEEIRRAEDFSSWARVWSWSALAVSLLTACAFGFTRLGPALVERMPRPWVVRVVLAVAALQLVGRVVTLPFAIMLRRLVRRYGLSEQSWSAYAVDLLKGQAVGLVVVSVAVIALVACARRWPRAWPAVSGALLGVLVLLGSFVYPLLVEPLFNDFTPLPDGPLRVRILELADREGVEVDDVLVADASRRTTTLNAYVSGIGASRRVVVYDTLVEDLSEAQALSVVAHELAHARHQDVVTGSLLGAAGAAVGTGLLGLLVPTGGARRDVRDPRTVPRLLALVAVAGLLAAPVQNGISRRIETRADVDALRATHDPEAFVGMQVQLARRSLADPTPPALSAFWFGSHPTTLERIAVAERFADE